LGESKIVETYAICWSDLLERAKRKLSYLNQEMVIRDRSVQAFFEEDFSEIDIQNISEKKK